MSGEESMSFTSQGSTMQMGNDDATARLPNYIHVFYQLMFPLYPQRKRDRLSYNIFIWIVNALILLSLSVYRIDTDTNSQTVVSKFVSFVNLTSIGLMLGRNLLYLILVVFVLCLFALFFQILVAVFYKEIISSQPWIITATSIYINVILRIGLIPAITTAITSFDCFSESSIDDQGNQISQSFWRANNSLGCFKDTFQIVTFVVSIILLLYLIIYGILINIMIYNHNPKHGGLFSTPSGKFNTLQFIFTFLIVFSQRLLYGWPFWRGVVSVGLSVILVIILILIDPYYTFISNYLTSIPWIVFGSLRLCLEIGYALEKSSESIVPEILYMAIGVVLSIFAIIFVYLFKSQRVGQKWILTDKKLPLVKVDDNMMTFLRPELIRGKSFALEKKPNIFTKKIQRTASQLPKFKDPMEVQRKVRFLQVREYRTQEYLNYADFVYTTALKRNSRSPDLHYDYGNFLLFYRKNWMKAQSVYKVARAMNPSIPLDFVLYSKTKDVSAQGGASGSSGQQGLAAITFKIKSEEADKYHLLAKDSLKDFYENLTQPKINFDMIYPHLRSISENESKSRECYDQLMTLQPQNTTVLRNYARLLLDIYHDEDTAEIILQRAEHFEEENASVLDGQGNDKNKNKNENDNEFHEFNYDQNSRYNSANNSPRKQSAASSETSSQFSQFSQFGMSAAFGNQNNTLINSNNNNNTNQQQQQTPNQSKQPNTKDGKQIDQKQSDADKDKDKDKKDKNKNKKKKKRNGDGSEDAMLANIISGGRNTGRSSLRKMAITLVVLSYILACLSSITACVVYVQQCKDYARRLTNLHNVCMLSGYQARLAPLCLIVLFHDLQYNYNYTGINDGLAETIPQWPSLQGIFAQLADQITTVVSAVYDSSAALGAWESADIPTYVFDLQTSSSTSGSQRKEPQVMAQELELTNLMRSLTQLAQKAAQVSRVNTTHPVDEIASWYSDIDYMIFNSLQAVLNGVKKAILNYWQEIKNVTDQIMIIQMVIIVSLTVLTFSVVFLTFIYFTIKVRKEREQVMIQLLDVPKIKMQAVIRRLLQQDDQDQDAPTVFNSNFNNNNPDFIAESDYYEKDSNVVSSSNSTQDSYSERSDNEKQKVKKKEKEKSNEKSKEGSNVTSTIESNASNLGFDQIGGALAPIKSESMLTSITSNTKSQQQISALQQQQSTQLPSISDSKSPTNIPLIQSSSLSPALGLTPNANMNVNTNTNKTNNTNTSSNPQVLLPLPVQSPGTISQQGSNSLGLNFGQLGKQDDNLIRNQIPEVQSPIIGSGGGVTSAGEKLQLLQPISLPPLQLGSPNADQQQISNISDNSFSTGRVCLIIKQINVIHWNYEMSMIVMNLPYSLIQKELSVSFINVNMDQSSCYSYSYLDSYLSSN
ncbi:MAG: hypothetical protein EZS28_008169 [Streblomastix strix]|uniref:TmcB/TmcC TPR repeats domain-containing protein n=2 Tax=Streblomastix strix TaxID=222440 RepID=A0A5J4WNZ6_9EUKA|nr:MAG: hypothetical protein EZS28_008169 [Streblomastix strix]